MNVPWIVELTDDERATLHQFTSGGGTKARKIKGALILLAADGGRSDADIAASVGVGTSTAFRVKRAFIEEGLEEALEEAPRPGGARKLSGHEEALLIATACALPPLGRARWTLELLASEMVRLTDHASISSETVRRRLAENDLKPWQKKMWCIRSRLRSACSNSNASICVSEIARRSSARSQLGKLHAMRPARKFNGYSTSPVLARRCDMLTPSWRPSTRQTTPCRWPPGETVKITDGWSI